MRKTRWRLLLVVVCVHTFAPVPINAQSTRVPSLIGFERSAEFGWLRKPVHAARTLDDLTRPDAWRSSGTAAVTFPPEPRRDDMRVLRVDMQMFRDAPAPTRNRLLSVNLRRAVDGEDKYYREGIHYVTPENNKWTQVVWEIEPLARDRVTAIEIGYWVNKMLALPGDTVAFEIGRIELQQLFFPRLATGGLAFAAARGCFFAQPCG